MVNYSEFIVGLWLVPVVLCIIVPLTMLILWSIKRILTDISTSGKRVEGAVAKNENKSTGDLRPQPTA